VKIGPVDPEFFLLKYLFKKEKITQAEHIARGAYMRRGLKYPNLPSPPEYLNTQ